MSQEDRPGDRRDRRVGPCAHQSSGAERRVGRDRRLAQEALFRDARTFPVDRPDGRGELPRGIQGRERRDARLLHGLRGSSGRRRRRARRTRACSRTPYRRSTRPRRTSSTSACVQGTKYYGQHLGPFKTPAKEDDPRPPIQHFYYDQQDLLMRLRQGKAWSYSTTRPHVICGFALGNPLNIISILAVYATILREMGKPLTFPGQTRRVHVDLSGNRRGPARARDDLDGDDAGLRGPVVQRHQRRLLPLSESVAGLRAALRHGAWRRRDNRSRRRDGRQGAALGGDQPEVRPQGPSDLDAGELEFRQLRAAQRLGRDVLDHETAAVRILRSDRLRDDVPRPVQCPAARKDHPYERSDACRS